MIIYKITSPSGKVYIGQTIKTLEERIRQHKVDSKNPKYPINFAFAKYENEMNYEIIDKAISKEDLSKKEMYWILFYKSNETKFGYNCTGGGESGGTGLNSRFIFIYTLDGEFVSKVKEDSDCAKIIGVSEKEVTMCLRKSTERKVLGNYFLSFYANFIPEIKEKEILPFCCPFCSSDDYVKNSFFKTKIRNVQRFKCRKCKKKFTDPNLDIKFEKRINLGEKILELFLKGYSQNKIAKELGCARNTIQERLKKMQNK